VMFDGCCHSMGMKRQADQSTFAYESSSQRGKKGAFRNSTPSRVFGYLQEPTRVSWDQVFPGDEARVQSCARAQSHQPPWRPQTCLYPHDC
jgi:hypothetical protein